MADTDRRDIVGELAYAPALGHPARLSGREAVVGHARWFQGAVENFRFFDLRAYPLADAEGAVAEVKAQGRTATCPKLGAFPTWDDKSGH